MVAHEPGHAVAGVQVELEEARLALHDSPAEVGPGERRARCFGDGENGRGAWFGGGDGVEEVFGEVELGSGEKDWWRKNWGIGVEDLESKSVMGL